MDTTKIQRTSKIIEDAKPVDPLFQVATIPDNFKRVSPPDFISPDSIPIGAFLTGKVLAIDGDFTGDPELKDTQNLRMMCAGDRLIWFPLTGVLEHAVMYWLKETKQNGTVQLIVGKEIVIRRLQDAHSNRYNNRMFKLELFVK